MLCDSDGEDTSCDVLDVKFPIRDYLVPTLIELCEKEILGVAYRPKEESNDDKDNLADIASFIRRNVKSSLQQQIEG